MSKVRTAWRRTERNRGARTSVSRTDTVHQTLPEMPAESPSQTPRTKAGSDRADIAADGTSQLGPLHGRSILRKYWETKGESHRWPGRIRKNCVTADTRPTSPTSCKPRHKTVGSRRPPNK